MNFEDWWEQQTLPKRDYEDDSDYAERITKNAYEAGQRESDIMHDLSLDKEST